jgi:hypothetical protein
LTEVIIPRKALITRPAASQRQRGNSVACHEAFIGARPETRYHSGELVTHDLTELDMCAAAIGVEVRPTDPARRNTNRYVLRTELRLGDVHHLDIAVSLEACCLHGLLLSNDG